jgi:hypothetical protein
MEFHCPNLGIGWLAASTDIYIYDVYLFNLCVSIQPNLIRYYSQQFPLWEWSASFVGGAPPKWNWNPGTLKPAVGLAG